MIFIFTNEAITQELVVFCQETNIMKQNCHLSPSSTLCRGVCVSACKKKGHFLSQDRTSCNRLITKRFIIKISVLEKNIKGQMVQTAVYKYAHSKLKGQVHKFLKLLSTAIM